MTVVSSSVLPLRWDTALDRSGTLAVVTVRGELDRLTAPLLFDHLLWLAASHRGAVDLDLSAVAFIDLGGHDVLRRVGHHYQGRGVPISASDPSPPVRRLLDVVGWPIPRRPDTRARWHRTTCRRHHGGPGATMLSWGPDLRP